VNGVVATTGRREPQKVVSSGSSGIPMPAVLTLANAPVLAGGPTSNLEDVSAVCNKLGPDRHDTPAGRFLRPPPAEDY